MSGSAVGLPKAPNRVAFDGNDRVAVSDKAGSVRVYTWPPPIVEGECHSTYVHFLLQSFLLQEQLSMTKYSATYQCCWTFAFPQTAG